MMRIDAVTERERALVAAAAAARRGDLILMPTENVYAIATDAFHVRGTSAMRVAKGYGPHVSLPLFVASADMVGGVAQTTALAESLMEAFWPGLLTLVLPSHTTLAWDVAVGGTVAVRMPVHPVALDLVRRTGPLAVTTANPAGADPPTNVPNAAGTFGSAVRVALDVGDLDGAAMPSTMVDLTGDAPRVLREGSVSRLELAAVLPDLPWDA